MRGQETPIPVIVQMNLKSLISGYCSKKHINVQQAPKEVSDVRLSDCPGKRGMRCPVLVSPFGRWFLAG